jgi:hypothetical protein
MSNQNMTQLQQCRNPSPLNIKQSLIKFAQKTYVTLKNCNNKHVFWNFKSLKVI